MIWDNLADLDIVKARVIYPAVKCRYEIHIDRFASRFSNAFPRWRHFHSEKVNNATCTL